MPQNKPTPISPLSLARLNDFLAQHLGLNFNESRWPELERGIRLAAAEFGFPDPGDCIQWLMASPSQLSGKQIEILSTHLTIGETYFFREPETFEVLGNDILPQLSRASAGKPRSLRIWSIACSTGEEAYSIAIVLDQEKERWNDWNISILATDINLKSLEKAQNGIYTEWSFREMPDRVKQDYFIPHPKNTYEIKPHIKPMVTFAYLNLVEDVYPSLLNNTNAMDIIFCRNVLMYFLPQKAEVVAQRLNRTLVDGGWLMVSPADSFHFLAREGFQRYLSHTSVFTKSEKTGEPPGMELPYRYETEAKPPGVDIFPGPEEITPNTFPGSPPQPQEKITPPTPGKKEENLSLYTSALRYYLQGNYREVIAQLHEYLRANPHPQEAVPGGSPGGTYSRGDIYALLSRSYANLGQLTDAHQWSQKAIETDKLNPGYHYLQVTIFQEQGQEEAAVQSLKKCLYIDPNFILAHFTLGDIRYRQKNREEAGKHWRNALSLLEIYDDGDSVSLEDGLTAGRLREIIKTTLSTLKG